MSWQADGIGPNRAPEDRALSGDTRQRSRHDARGISGAGSHQADFRNPVGLNFARPLRAPIGHAPSTGVVSARLRRPKAVVGTPGFSGRAGRRLNCDRAAMGRLCRQQPRCCSARRRAVCRQAHAPGAWSRKPGRHGPCEANPRPAPALPVPRRAAGLQAARERPAAPNRLCGKQPVASRSRSLLPPPRPGGGQLLAPRRPAPARGTRPRAPGEGGRPGGGLACSGGEQPALALPRAAGSASGAHRGAHLRAATLCLALPLAAAARRRPARPEASAAASCLLSLTRRLGSDGAVRRSCP